MRVKNVSSWLATCARKPRFPIQIQLLVMLRDELSVAIARLMSNSL